MSKKADELGCKVSLQVLPDRGLVRGDDGQATQVTSEALKRPRVCVQNARLAHDLEKIGEEVVDKSPAGWSLFRVLPVRGGGEQCNQLRNKSTEVQCDTSDGDPDNVRGEGTQILRQLASVLQLAGDSDHQARQTQSGFANFSVVQHSDVGLNQPTEQLNEVPRLRQHFGLGGARNLLQNLEPDGTAVGNGLKGR